MSYPLPITLLAHPAHVAEVPHTPAPPRALQLIHAVLEALMGRRPLHQLRPHLRWQAFDNLACYVDAGDFRRVRVGRVRSQMPTPRAVEANVSLLVAGRVVSCALRLDATRAGWRCTELTIIAPMGARTAGAAVAA
ncbi:Rv3235 family protein [Tessaracoccus sp. G1721]